MVCQSSSEVVIYSDLELDRKIRRDRSKWPVVSEDEPSSDFSRHIRTRKIAELMRAAKLTPLERRVFILRLHGATLRQIGKTLGISSQRVHYSAAVVKRKLRLAKADRYFGLHDVYLSEVRRYIYRKPRHAAGSRTNADAD